jgi:hypothetical protein
MVAVPAATGVIAPVVALMVATFTSLDDQVPPAFPLVVNVDVPDKQTPWVPFNVPALGAAVTVTVRVLLTAEQLPDAAMV